MTLDVCAVLDDVTVNLGRGDPRGNRHGPPGRDQ
jgi:hypothetical protein